jgi:hypothetical protein
MVFGRVLVLAALLSAPAFAQSGYVFELDAGKLVPARSTEGLAPSGSAAVPQGVAIAQASGPSVPSGRGSARASASGVSDGLYFRSCAEAERAGYSSMAIGTPGYREGLDGDHDGVACEPYTGRRGSFRRRR